jgi:predicted O-linked N-acetylglucosamine transferase (SPINDLY family)
MSSPDLSPLLDALARELDRYRLDPQSTHAVRAAAHALACEFAGLTKADRDHPAVPGVQELARGLWDAGFLGRAVPPEDLALAGDLSARGWPGLLGAMLFTPCWQWPAAPALDAAPDWLWGHFVDWVCVAPCAATAVGAADLHLGQLEILAEAVQRWAGRNIAAPCVKAAVETLERHRGLTSPLRSTLSLRRWQAARAAIFAKQLRHHTDRAAAPAAYARAGRLLRVGVVAADWGESLASRARLPWLAALDPATFTVHLFADVARYDALEKTFRVFAAKLHVFSAKNDERIEAVRAADLDVLIFCGRLAGAHEQQLAMHRLSPLQAVTDECPWALSLPEIDLHLTGSAADAAELGERIGLLPAPGLDWDADTVPVTLEGPSRAELGLPVAGPVFVSAPSLEHLGPETLRAWVALLRANADSAFLLLPPAGSDTFVLEQLFAALQASDGVDASRFVISLGDPRGCFRHGDVYLDTFPYSAPTPLQAALAAGLPAVAWEGATHRSRTGARVLRALGQDDWVAADEAGYCARR